MASYIKDEFPEVFKAVCAGEMSEEEFGEWINLLCDNEREGGYWAGRDAEYNLLMKTDADYNDRS